MSRRLFLLLTACLAVLASACTPPSADDEVAEETTTVPSLPPSTTLPPPPSVPELSDEEIAALGGLPGRLVFTLGPAVGLVNPNGSNAGLVAGGSGTAATQPTFSNEGGLLAYSLRSNDGAAIQVFDQQSGTMIDSALDGAGAFYLQWDRRDTGVGYLQNSPSSRDIEAGFAPVGAPAVPYGTGTPYFFDTNPDQVLWIAHVGDEVLLVDEAGAQPVDLAFRNFSVPRWVDAQRVMVATVDGLVVVDLVEGTSVTFDVPPGDLEFVLSPDGARVAYLEPPRTDALPTPDAEEPDPGNPDAGDTESGDAESGDDDNAEEAAPTQPPLPRLIVLDLESGESTIVAEQRVFAFEWSPDGTRLAWMGLDTADAANLAEWHFWTEGEEYAVSPSYRPSELYLNAYLPFFSQYAVSHSSWAPDGSGFVFAGSFRGDTGIFVQALPDPEDPSVVGTDPLLIARGDVAFWSPDENPIGGGGGGSIA